LAWPPRLSIIDLSTATAMMTGQGNWIVYNGEIYNYIELRRELGEENFVTTSDIRGDLLPTANGAPDA